MAEEKETKVEKEIKKLDDLKETPENKAAIAAAEGKNLAEDSTDNVDSKKNVESKPAVAKPSKKEKKFEATVELEREYTVPLKRGVLNVPHYRRAKKAVRVLKEFLAKHMKVEGRDLKKVKIDLHLNNEIWFRGIKKPMNKIKVIAKKIDGVVYAELADVPEVVKFAKARAEKRSAAAASAKVKTPKPVKEDKAEDADHDGISDEVEEKEDLKAGAELGAKFEKAVARTQKHTAKVKTGEMDKMSETTHRKAMKR